MSPTLPHKGHSYSIFWLWVTAVTGSDIWERHLLKSHGRIIEPECVVYQGWVSAVTSSPASAARQRTTTSRLCLWSERWAITWDSFSPTVWGRWAVVIKYTTTETNYIRGFVITDLSASSAQKTHAYHRLQDDVPAEAKQRRLQECISVFREEAARVNAALIGSTQLVLVEGVSTACD